MNRRTFIKGSIGLLSAVAVGVGVGVGVEKWCKYEPDSLYDNPATILKQLAIESDGKDNVDLESFNKLEESCEEKILISEVQDCKTIFARMNLCAEKAKTRVWWVDGKVTLTPPNLFTGN